MVKNVYLSSCKVLIIIIIYYGQISMKLEPSRQTFEKYLNIIFHEDPSIANGVVLCARTDMTKLIAALRNFAKALKNCLFGLRA